jgi:hypothetical protein
VKVVVVLLWYGGEEGCRTGSQKGVERGRETKLLYGEGVGRDAGVWAGEREARGGKGWDG